jgi:hypothetical protein
LITATFKDTSQMSTSHKIVSSILQEHLTLLFILLTGDHYCRLYQNNKIHSLIRYLHFDRYFRKYESIIDQGINLVFKEAFDQLGSILYDTLAYFLALQGVSFSVVVVV